MDFLSRFILIFFLCPGVCLTVEVRQSPSDIITKPGDKVQVFCSHNETDYRQMFWYQRSPGDTAMKLIGYLRYNDATMEETYKGLFNITGKLGGDEKKNGSLNLQSVEASDSAVYFCAVLFDIKRQCCANYEAYFGQGTKLTVLENDLEVTPPTNVKILPPSPNECRNQKDKKRKKTLVCVASGFYPDHVEVLWKTNGKEAKDGVATDSAAKRVDKFYRITSRLRVPAEDYNTASNTFTCIVSFFDGEKKILREASINGTQGISFWSIEI
uniref:Ig-like domain-containing protein n=1 Tax=Amphiprion ocellaris TaxID=80972 RepID=A0AAQ5Y743_AMPOC